MKTQKEITIPANFVPRDYQLPILKAFDNGARFLDIVAHRRSGKDKVCVVCVAKAMAHRVGGYYYVFPEFNQGRKALWDNVDNDGFRTLKHIPEELWESINSQQMKLTLKNGSYLQVVGSNEIDSIVGSNPLGLVFSEWSLQDPRVLGYLEPIIEANGGWEIFNYTPRGDNHAKRFHEEAKRQMESGNRDWFSTLISVEDTGIFSESKLEEIKGKYIQRYGDDALFQQEYYCFPGGTDITTDKGQKDIVDIKVGDQVLSHSGRFRRVERLIRREVNEELVEIVTYGNSKPLWCTGNHPLRVLNVSDQTYSWKRADEVTSRDMLVMPRLKTGEKLLPEELIVLIGWYITEGSSGKNYITFSLSSKEIKESNEIKMALEALGYRYKEKVNGSVRSIQVNSNTLTDFLTVNCGQGALNKRIPLTLIRGYEELVYKILMAGDGCRARSNLEEWDSYTTVSKSLAYDIQLLASSLGYRAGIGRKKGNRSISGRVVNGRDSYSVQVRFKKRGVKIRPARHGVGVRVRKVSKVQYSGLVYNLSVKFDESYVADGRVVHNCSFETPVMGAYYAVQYRVAQAEGRIGKVEHNPDLMVYTAWDLGVSDNTVIIFYQKPGGDRINVIDHYEMYGAGMEHYRDVLLSKGYNYGVHYLPHDADNRLQGRTIETRADMLRDLMPGQRFEIVDKQKKVGVMDGIQKVRSMFYRFHFDEKKCDRLLKCLKEYHSKQSRKDEGIKGIMPDHDHWSSHSADAFRILCVSFRDEGEFIDPNIYNTGAINRDIW